MNLPKQRIYRALVKSGTCTPEQLKEIDRKLNYDPKVQKEFLWMWRKRKGRLFTGLRSLVNWIILHREEIIRILGIAVMFLDEEPEFKEKPHVKTETSTKAKPKPKAKKKEKVVTPPKPVKTESEAKPEEPKPIFEGWADEDEEDEDKE